MRIYSHCERIRCSLRTILRPCSDEDRGSALVEFALMLPIFVLLLLGAAEFARLTYYSIELANAARAAVQYGAQNHATAADFNGILNAAQSDAVEIMGGSDVSSSPKISLTNPTTTTYCTCSDGTIVTLSNAASLCLAPAKIYTFVQVNLSAQITPYIQAPGLPTTYTLTSNATMRVLQ